VPEVRRNPELPARTERSLIIDVPVNAAQVVSVQTTERDRSMGYLLRIVPLSVAFAVVSGGQGSGQAGVAPAWGAGGRSGAVFGLYLGAG
jgi:hypothetical protein